jgi:hypothetical protein
MNRFAGEGMGLPRVLAGEVSRLASLTKFFRPIDLQILSITYRY